MNETKETIPKRERNMKSGKKKSSPVVVIGEMRGAVGKEPELPRLAEFPEQTGEPAREQAN